MKEYNIFFFGSKNIIISSQKRRKQKGKPKSPAQIVKRNEKLCRFPHY